MKIKISIFLFIVLLLTVFQAFKSNLPSNELNPQSLFKTYCVNCHGIDGSLKTNGAMDLKFSPLSLDERILIITEGRNTMTAFGNTLTQEQIKMLAEYTLELTK